MDLLIGYSYRVGVTARPDIVVMQYRFHATPCKTASGNSWKQFYSDPTVGSIVMDLWIRYSYRVVVTARPDIVVVQFRFHAPPCKTASGNSWKQF